MIRHRIQGALYVGPIAVTIALKIPWGHANMQAVQAIFQISFMAEGRTLKDDVPALVDTDRRLGVLRYSANAYLLMRNSRDTHLVQNDEYSLPPMA